MECIHINCNKCSKYMIKNDKDAIPMEYDDDVIKNIIDSNYLIMINICSHHIDSFNKLQNKFINTKFMYVTWMCYVYNYNYCKLYGRFDVMKTSESAKINILSYVNGLTIELCIKDLVNVIKKGSIIQTHHFIGDDPYLELKTIIESNSTFTIKKICKMNYPLLIIDESSLTKRAIK